MRIRLTRVVSAIVLFSGVIALILPLFLPPAPVLPNWTAFVPYAVFALALGISKGIKQLRFLSVVTTITVVAGTWVYWDSMRFNHLFTWQAFGLITRYVPLFQLAVAIPALGYAAWACRSSTKKGVAH